MSNDWIEELMPRHERLTDLLTSIIKGLLAERRISYLSVSGRTKTIEGVREKIRRKNYADAKRDLTDLSGVRIVTFSEIEVDLAAKLIEESFNVDRANSLDKSSLLGIDQIGYRSVHFVCDLGASRKSIPEYALFTGLKFEIQVRTVLQHAWAELSHDRQYKFNGVLPEHLQRQMYLYAGMLELADSGIARLVTEIETYSREITTKIDKNENLDTPLNSLAVVEFFKHLSSALHIRLLPILIDDQIIRELNEFEIKSVRDLVQLIDKEFLEAIKKVASSNTYVGFLRDAMMFRDLERYFEVWGRSWGGLDPSTIDLLAMKYDRKLVLDILRLHGVDILFGYDEETG